MIRTRLLLLTGTEQPAHTNKYNQPFDISGALPVAMDQRLRCNNQTGGPCRAVLSQEAVVTTCSHVSRPRLCGLPKKSNS